jgi:nicotinamidase-related amidase
MELLDASRSVVLVIDLQGKLMEQIHRSRLVVEATKRLLRVADLFGVPVLLTEQYPKGLGPTHPEVREVFDALSAPKRVLEKNSFGCCSEPQFGAVLREIRPGVLPPERQLILAGIEAHVCVMQTAVELLARGEQVHLCWECVSGRGEEHRRFALERMRQAGAVVTNLESAAFEWCRTKDHPRFKELSALLKEGQLG